MLATMIGIFALSSQDGTESGNLSKWLAESGFGRFLLKFLPPLTGEGAELDIRKYAHIGEYTMLSLFSGLFFVELLEERVPKHSLFPTLLLCFLFACSDEFHQTLISGRAGQFSDVLVDMIGVVLGVLLSYPISGHRKESV